MPFVFPLLIRVRYLSHFLCPKWVGSVYGASKPGLPFLSHQPPKDPLGCRQPAHPRCQSRLRLPGFGVSCTSSSRPWRCQSVWSDSSRYCRTIPETWSWETWRITQKIRIKGELGNKNCKAATILSCKLLFHKTELFFLLHGSGLAQWLLWPQRLVEVMLCKSRACQLPLAAPGPPLQLTAMWTSPK